MDGGRAADLPVGVVAALHDVGETDGLVTLRYTLTGTNDGDLFGMPASDRKFYVENCTLLRVVGGKVKNAYRYSDTLGLMTQLGAMPARG